jgi:hypothetical protein
MVEIPLTCKQPLQEKTWLAHRAAVGCPPRSVTDLTYPPKLKTIACIDLDDKGPDVTNARPGR